MKVFIKEKSIRRYFKARQIKMVRMIHWCALVHIKAAPIIRRFVIKPFADQIHDNVRRLSNYMGYQAAILNCPQHHQAEYTALSTVLREIIRIVNLLEELKVNGFNVHTSTPKVTCYTFEDNKSSIEISKNHRTRTIFLSFFRSSYIIFVHMWYVRLLLSNTYPQKIIL